MRDKKLLNDLLLYLKVEDQKQTFGRLFRPIRRNLIKRLDSEIKFDPAEMAKMCSTFLYLFSREDVQCEPRRVWVALADKIKDLLQRINEAEFERNPMNLDMLEQIEADMHVVSPENPPTLVYGFVEMGAKCE